MAAAVSTAAAAAAAIMDPIKERYRRQHFVSDRPLRARETPECHDGTQSACCDNGPKEESRPSTTTTNCDHCADLSFLCA